MLRQYDIIPVCTGFVKRCWPETLGLCNVLSYPAEVPRGERERKGISSERDGANPHPCAGRKEARNIPSQDDGWLRPSLVRRSCPSPRWEGQDPHPLPIMCSCTSQCHPVTHLTLQAEGRMQPKRSTISRTTVPSPASPCGPEAHAPRGDVKLRTMKGPVETRCGLQSLRNHAIIYDKFMPGEPG
jgi:hypothetical protein